MALREKGGEEKDRRKGRTDEWTGVWQKEYVSRTKGKRKDRKGMTEVREGGREGRQGMEHIDDNKRNARGREKKRERNEGGSGVRY